MQFIRNQMSLSQHIEEATFELTEAEIAPGVVMERRMVLGGGLGLLAAILAPNWTKGLGQASAAEGPAGETIELETLIARLRPEARRLIASDKPDEEAYIRMALTTLQTVNKLDTDALFDAGPGLQQDLQASVPPLQLYQIRMSPNSIIELHDHRHHNGALSVREGSIRVRSFDIFQEEGDKKWDVAAGQVPEGEEFLIQEKGESALKQGQAIGLTRTRDNIHQVEAGPDGCLLYDLFTNFNIQALSYQIKWDGQYVDRAKKLCKVIFVPSDLTY